MIPMTQYFAFERKDVWNRYLSKQIILWLVLGYYNHVEFTAY